MSQSDRATARQQARQERMQRPNSQEP
jgi:hypothetical protein